MSSKMFAIIMLLFSLLPNNDIIAEDRVRFIVFSARWCRPCQQLKADLKREKIKFEEIDVDDKPILAEERNIKAYPTSIIYVETKERERFEGHIGIPKIRALLNKYKE